MADDKNQNDSFGSSDLSSPTDSPLERGSQSGYQSFDTVSRDTFYQATSQPPADKIDPLVGEILDGRFLIERNLSDGDAAGGATADKGGIGVVYLGKDLKNISRQVVVKAIRNDVLQQDADVLRKFQHEREALLRFDHPNIVGLLDSGTLPDGNPYLVMPFIQGRSLRRVLKEAGGQGLNFDLCADVIEAVTDALAAAHAEGILHRDIKPENVMLTTQASGRERIRLIDFGIARVADSKMAPVTQHNRIIGTILYIAPEQLRGELRQTPAVDVYSCGSMFYEMLTGARPFDPRTIIEMGDLQREGVKTPPSAQRPDISQAAEQILLQALAYEPEHRPQDIADFGRKLAAALRQNQASRRVAVDAATAPSKQLTETTPSQNLPGAASPASFGNLSAPTIAANQVSPPNVSDLPAMPAKSKTNSSKTASIAIGALVILLLLGAGGFAVWRVSKTEKDNANASASPSPKASPAAAEPDKKLLSYFLEVQKMRGGMPYEEPFRATGQEIFENGYKFKIALVSDTNGFLYLFNEGKDAAGTTVYNILYPTPKRNDGSAELDKNVAAETGINTFAGGKGTEIIWVAWSTQSNSDLEAARQNAFDNKGVVADRAIKQKLVDFLQKYAENQPETVKDAANVRTTIKTADDTFAYKMQLEHR